MIPRGKKENGKKYSSKKSEGGGEKNENQNRKKIYSSRSMDSTGGTPLFGEFLTKFCHFFKFAILNFLNNLIFTNFVSNI